MHIFFPYKFMGLRRRCRPRGAEDANFCTRDDPAQRARAQQSATPRPLLRPLTQQLGREQALGWLRWLCRAWVTLASSEDERPSAGPRGEAAR